MFCCVFEDLHNGAGRWELNAMTLEGPNREPVRNDLRRLE